MVLTIAFNSINHYLVDCRNGYLLVDAGWASSLPRPRGELGRHGVALAAIKYVMSTHAHPDHAGLTQEVKKASGARLVIHERQLPYLQELRSFYRCQGGYEPIAVEPGDVVVKGEGNGEYLEALGINGELVPTPGHSEDGVSLVLAGGLAVTGDLHLPDQVGPDRYETICVSWRRLLSLGARTAYPGHGEPIDLGRVAEQLAGPAG